MSKNTLVFCFKAATAKTLASLKGAWNIVSWGNQSPYEYKDYLSFDLASRVLGLGVAVPTFAYVGTALSHGFLRPFMDTALPDRTSSVACAMMVAVGVGYLANLSIKVPMRLLGDRYLASDHEKAQKPHSP